MKDIIKNFKEFLPILFEQDIVSEKELCDLNIWYSSDLRERKDFRRPVYFMDRLYSAMEGDKQSQAFLRFYQEKLSILLDEYKGKGGFDKNIKTKIRNSILCKVKHPSFMDNIGELLLITHLIQLSKADGYQYLGTEFKLGNKKDADIAFQKGKNIQLIEVKSIHYLHQKDLIEVIGKQAETKLSSKTENKEIIEEYLKKEYPNSEITLTIALFIWEEAFDIKSSEENIEELIKNKKDDMFQPVTLICQKDTKGDFHWDVAPLGYVLQRCKENQTDKNN